MTAAVYVVRVGSVLRLVIGTTAGYAVFCSFVPSLRGATRFGDRAVAASYAARVGGRVVRLVPRKGAR